MYELGMSTYKRAGAVDVIWSRMIVRQLPAFSKNSRRIPLSTFFRLKANSIVNLPAEVDESAECNAFNLHTGVEEPRPLPTLSTRPENIISVEIEDALMADNTHRDRTSISRP